MMGLFDFFKKKQSEKIEKKSYNDYSSLFASSNDTKYYSKRDFIDFYRRNPVVNKTINIISSALSNINIQAWDETNNRVFDIHPLLSLLKRPNEGNTQSSFLFKWSIYHLVHGVSYLEKITNSQGKILELNLLNPINITAESDNEFYPTRLVVLKTHTEQITYNRDVITGKFRIDSPVGRSEICQFIDIDIDNSIDGLSPLLPCGEAVEAHSYAIEWNKSLLENKANPSYKVEMDKEQDLSPDQLKAVKASFAEYEGVKRAGKGIVLPAGLKLDVFGLSPADMDFSKMLDKMAEYIGAVYKVPNELIVQSNATYNNVSQAKVSLYRDSVLPLMNRMLEFLSLFFENEFENIVLKYDEDSIEALFAERAIKIESLTKAVGQSPLTIDEVRKELGYNPKEGLADDILVQRGIMPLGLVGEEEEGVEEIDQ